MKQLPTGLQEFEYIRRNDALYVDKTGMIYELVSGVIDQYFISRPRCFGKTLLCWTLDALFRGKRELFEGLAISKTDWAWECYPVIHLNMSAVDTTCGVDGVMESLRQYTKGVAHEFGIDVSDITMPELMLDRIITRCSRKFDKPVVVIIDEYDTPFLNVYNKPQEAEEVRNIMMSYYSGFKSREQHIRFLFMTGISKFTQDWVCSSRNKIYDISLKEEFGALLGYTEKELVENFGEYLEAGAKKLNVSVGELTEKVSTYYNGFCFDGTNRVYCPYTVLNFFENFEFTSHWMNSGSIKVIADYMNDRNLTVEQFSGLPVLREFARIPGEVETALPEGFLYQAGYLTLRKDDYDDFLFEYPNVEVLKYMSKLVCANIIHRGGCNWDISLLLLNALKKGNCDLFVETINRLLASIPYDDYAKAAQRAIKRSGLPAGEWLYRSNILAFLRGCGVLAFGEMHTNKGRSDLVVCHRGAAWVIEIKVAYNNDGKALAQEALEQINAGQYADPFKTAKKVGIAIDDKTRQINDWVAG